MEKEDLNFFSASLVKFRCTAYWQQTCYSLYLWVVCQKGQWASILLLLKCRAQTNMKHPSVEVMCIGHIVGVLFSSEVSPCSHSSISRLITLGKNDLLCFLARLTQWNQLSGSCCGGVFGWLDFIADSSQNSGKKILFPWLLWSLQIVTDMTNLDTLAPFPVINLCKPFQTVSSCSLLFWLYVYFSSCILDSGRMLANALPSP